MCRYYPQIRLRLIYKSLDTIGSRFTLKDKMPEDCMSCLIYQYKCDSCNATIKQGVSRQRGWLETIFSYGKTKLHLSNSQKKATKHYYSNKLHIFAKPCNIIYTVFKISLYIFIKLFKKKIQDFFSLFQMYKVIWILETRKKI